MRGPQVHLPLLPAHSISKLRILNGATFDHSPSAACDIKSSQEMSTSSWHRDTIARLLDDEEELPACRLRYLPAGSSIQLQPTTLVSVMNLKWQKTISMVKELWCNPQIVVSINLGTKEEEVCSILVSKRASHMEQTFRGR